MISLLKIDSSYGKAGGRALNMGVGAQEFPQACFRSVEGCIIYMTVSHGSCFVGVDDSDAGVETNLYELQLNCLPGGEAVANPSSLYLCVKGSFTWSLAR